MRPEWSEPKPWDASEQRLGGATLDPWRSTSTPAFGNAPPVLAETLAAALICLDPGHGTAPEVGRQLEPIGPGSRELKVKDGGGAAGEAPVALAIARHTRTLLLARGFRVALTRERDGYRGGNRERARLLQRPRGGADDPDPRRRLRRSRRDTEPRRSCLRCAAAGPTTSTRRARAPAGSSSGSSCARREPEISASSSAPT